MLSEYFPNGWTNGWMTNKNVKLKDEDKECDRAEGSVCSPSDLSHLPCSLLLGVWFAQRPLSCVLVDEVDAQAAALPCH